MGFSEADDASTRPGAHVLLAALSSAAAAANGLLSLSLPLLGSFLAALPRVMSLANGASKPKSALKCAPEDAFVVCRPTAADARALRELYDSDYVTCHREMHPGAAGRACSSDWEEALGKIDFADVIGDVAADRGTGEVRLLKCVEVADASQVVGYVLYELRSKGSKKSRQHYCELVNIVVSKRHQGRGAGRLLFSALQEDLARTARHGEADDLRLYVAERNLGPLGWYRRLGFRDAGWQTEVLNDTQVRFLRMMFKSA